MFSALSAPTQVPSDTLLKDVHVGAPVSENPSSGTTIHASLGDGRALLRDLLPTGGAVVGSLLYVTDGTPAGTYQLESPLGTLRGFEDFYNSPTEALLPDGRLVFHGSVTPVGTITPEPFRLFVTDGSPNGTQPVPDINGTLDLELREHDEFTAFGNHIYFIAEDGDAQPDLYRVDLTGSDIEKVRELDSILEYSPSSGNAFRVRLAAEDDSLLLYWGSNVGFTQMAVANAQTTLYRYDPAGDLLELLAQFSGVVPSYGSGTRPLASGDGLLIHLYDGLEFNITEQSDGDLYLYDGQNMDLLVSGLDNNWSKVVSWVKDLNGVNLFGRSGFGDAELWTTDGTVAGSTLVLDMGVVGGQVVEVAGGFVFNGSALSEVPDVELWFTDGTAAGTVQIADIYPGSTGSFPNEFRVWNGQLYFTATAPATGEEIYRVPLSSDFTQTVQPILVADFVPGTSGTTYTSSTNLASTPNGIVFRRPTEEFGSEPWVTQGDEASSQLLLDVNPPVFSDPYDSGIEFLGSTVDEVFFTAFDNPDTRSLWRSNGSPSGTVPALLDTSGVELDPGAFNQGPEVGMLVSEAVFSRETAGEGSELWITVKGGASQLIADLVPGLESSSPREFRSFAGKVVFVADQAQPAGTQKYRDLYITDGTSAGTEVLLDGTSLLSSNFYFLGESQGLLFFGRSEQGTGGTSVYATDGTPGGTQLVSPPAGFWQLDLGVHFATGEPAPIGVGDDFFLFWANSGGLFDRMHRVDAKTLEIDFFVGPWAPTGSSGIDILGSLAGAVLIQNANNLWISDGTEPGTSLILAAPAFPAFEDFRFVTSGDYGYMDFAVGSTGERRLVRTDGTAAGTSLLKSYTPSGSEDSILRQAVGGEGVLLLEVDDPTYGLELGRTFGAVGDEEAIADSAPFLEGSDLGGVARAGGFVFFVADDGLTGSELHAVPFGATGTSSVTPFGSGCSSSGLGANLAAAGNPKVGASFDLQLTDGAASSLAFHFYSGVGANIDASGGCTLYLGLPKYLGSSGTDSEGDSGFAVALPADPALVGLRVLVQSVVLEGTGPFADLFGLSSGLELIVGP